MRKIEFLHESVHPVRNKFHFFVLSANKEINHNKKKIGVREGEKKTTARSSGVRIIKKVYISREVISHFDQSLTKHLQLLPGIYMSECQQYPLTVVEHRKVH